MVFEADSTTEPSSKVCHRCRSKPPNCLLVWVVRVVCAQPGTVVCSRAPLSFVGAGCGFLFCWFVRAPKENYFIILSINIAKQMK